MPTKADPWVPDTYRDHRFDPVREDESTRTSVPYRTEVRTADPEELARRNEMEGTKRARRYLEVERATQMAKTAKSAVRDRLVSWAYHPDERVPLALLDNREVPAAWEDHDEWVAPHLLRRALADAERDGVHWTPLLDELSDWGAPWADSFQLTTEEVEITHGGLGSPRPPLKPEHQFSKLAPWIESRTEVDEVEPLFEFSSRPFLAWVAERTPVLSTELLERVLEEKPHTARFFAANPHLTPAQSSHLLAWAHTFVSGEEERRYSHHRWAAKQALKVLHERGVELTREHLDGLVDLVCDEERHDPTDEDTHLDGQQVNALWTLCAVNDERLTADELISLYEAARDNPRYVGDLLETGLHRPEFLTHVAENSSRFSIRLWLAKRYRARRVDGVWAVLRGSTSARVMAELLKDAEGEEFRKIFREMAAADPSRALELLETDPEDRSILDPDTDALEPEDLLPLLGSSHHEVRSRALVASAELGASEVPETARDDRGHRR